MLMRELPLAALAVLAAAGTQRCVRSNDMHATLPVPAEFAADLRSGSMFPDLQVFRGGVFCVLRSCKTGTASTRSSKKNHIHLH